MHAFLYEVVARIVAAYLAFDCVRTIRQGLAEGKIRFFNSDLLNWTTWIAHRDTTPIRFWMQIGIQVIVFVSCVFVAIFGWWQPNS